MRELTDIDYAKAIRTATSVASLQKAIKPYADVAEDAIAAANKMAETDWPEFKSGLDKESSGEFAGEDWLHKYGAIIMPADMLKITMLASKLQMPFGAVKIRLRGIKEASQ